jgi:hypothetical protein
MGKPVRQNMQGLDIHDLHPDLCTAPGKQSPSCCCCLDVGIEPPTLRLRSVQAGTGRISLDAMQKFASKYGGQALTFDELQLIFRDFKPCSDYMVSEEQFLVFFSKVSKTLINQDFNDMVAEMSQ